MPSSFMGLGIARSGMITYNAWLNTTGHNIANVKTTGYSRQVVNQQAMEAISLGTSYGMIGTGVEAISIDSQRDQYYDNKYRLSNTELGKYETLSYYMQNVEDYLYAKSSDSGAITNSMDLFFKSITSLTTDASNETIRTQVVGYANNLTQYIKEAATSLKNMQQDINGQIAETVDKINAYAEEIASLTRQINTIEVHGDMANDLRDSRATIIDELSELASVNVIEKVPASGSGMTQYMVYIDNAVLVDTYEYNTIRYEARDTYNSINDIDQLYDLRWSTGQDFGIHDTGLGGKLQALFQMRDGNNGEVFTGNVTAGAKGDTTLVVNGTNALSTDLSKLEIPMENGEIYVNHAKCEYEYFDCNVKADGTYEYTFHLKNPLSFDATGENMQVSDAVNYRGIPYYMAQLDEFVRTFSDQFNQVQTSGYTAVQDPVTGLYTEGNQFFVGVDNATGLEMNFTKTIKDRDYTFSSRINRTTDVSGGYLQTSYYRLTALTTSVDSNIQKNGKLLACSDSENGGIANGKNLSKMSALSDDTTMFHQGKPGSFLQILTASAGVDSEKVYANAKNAENIKNAVQSRRLSKSGVDEDEEAQNLIICQNLLNYQYKVLSVMNEVLDKLINGTAL